MDKELNQAIIVRSKLRNEFLKLKTQEKGLHMLSFPQNYYSKKSNSTLKTYTLVVLLIISYSRKQYLHFSLKKWVDEQENNTY